MLTSDFSMFRLGLTCIASLCLCACTGEMKNVGDLDGGSTDGGTVGDAESSSASMSSTTATTGPGTASSTTETTTTTGPSTATDGSDGTDTSVDCLPPGESTCAPAPLSVQARFVIDDEEWPFEPIDDLGQACTVAAVSDQGPNNLPRIELDCIDAAQQPVTHTVDVSVSPATLALFSDGMAVTFDYLTEMPWWVNRWFAIRDSGDALLIGGQDSHSFAPPVDCIPEQPQACNPYRPLMLEVSTDVCDTDPPTCGEMNPCYLVRRQAIAGSDGTLESPIEVFDRGMGQVADYELRVAEAAAWEDVLCTDTPSTWYRFVAARTQ